MVGDAALRVLAQRFERGDGKLYVFALPLLTVADVVPTPDPDVPFEGNRRVNVKHARDFAAYWLRSRRWATPPLLLDTPEDLDSSFEVAGTNGSLDIGTLALTSAQVLNIQILDGQHRTLGWTEIALQCRGIVRAASTQTGGRMASDPTPEVAHARTVLARLAAEAVTVELLDQTAMLDHKQYFFDIAANARGISRSVTTRFDQRDTINRVANVLAREHALLTGRIEFESDRVGATSPHLMTAAQLASIVTAVLLGPTGVLQEGDVEALTDESVHEVAQALLDLMLESLDDLTDVAEATISPAQLREESLAGSVTMLRCLAGVFHELAVRRGATGFDLVEIGLAATRDFFRALSPSLTGPVPDVLWETGTFAERTSRGPQARRQETRVLTRKLIDLAWPFYVKRTDADAVSQGAAAPATTPKAVDRTPEQREASSGGPARRTAFSSRSQGSSTRARGDRAETEPSAVRDLDGLSTYLTQVGHRTLLNAEEEVSLAERVEVGLVAAWRLQHGADVDPEERRDLGLLVSEGEVAKARFIEANLRLVVSIARQMGGPLELEDRISEGNFGLIRAVEKFDYRKGFKFSTYATWWIRQSISRAVADQGRIVRLPVHVDEQLRKVVGARRAWLVERGLEPTAGDIAGVLDIPEDKVVELDRLNQDASSLDALFDEEATGSDGPIDVVDHLEVGLEDYVEARGISAVVRDVVSALGAREAEIMTRRYGLRGAEETLEEIGQTFGVTRERVRQLEKKAKGALKVNPAILALIGPGTDEGWMARASGAEAPVDHAPTSTEVRRTTSAHDGRLRAGNGKAKKSSPSTVSAEAEPATAAQLLGVTVPAPLQRVAPTTPALRGTTSRGELPQRLLASDVYQRQRERAGRAAVPDEFIAALVTQLDARGGRAHQDGLAVPAQVPRGSVGPFLAAARRTLNIDGYQVLHVDSDGMVILDRNLLREQFGLTVEEPAAARVSWSAAR